jgi:hypothetical protein
MEMIVTLPGAEVVPSSLNGALSGLLQQAMRGPQRRLGCVPRLRLIFECSERGAVRLFNQPFLKCSPKLAVDGVCVPSRGSCAVFHRIYGSRRMRRVTNCRCPGLRWPQTASNVSVSR